MVNKLSLRQKFIVYGSLFSLALFIIFPIYFMFIISLKRPADIYRRPSLLPVNPAVVNYQQLLNDLGFVTNIGNSLLIATATTILSVLLAVFAAYSLVRLQYRGRRWVGRLILFSYLTPASLLFNPQAVIIARLRLANTLHGLVLVYLTFSTGLSTWLLMGYFRAIPPDLEEQAMVDGATRLGALFRVLLPVSAPGIVAVSVFTFTAAWNELLLALIFITSPDLRTVPVALNYLITGDTFRWGLIMAGAVASAVPVMILYYLAQRFVVQGLTAGSVKG